MIANPRVLVLDDATSSVDASTEQHIKWALAEAMAGRTTFVIAHRSSTIALADHIVVLERGRIVAQGSHEELLEVSELYREIVQLTGSEEDRELASSPLRTAAEDGFANPGEGEAPQSEQSARLRARRDGVRL